ncbi:hypothetical protein BJF93_16595 [Xaviernesmea oryzae]|uniref:Uncharacterized protein n=1 Tax=Xaviernesmea oryzae TaxID=464029 RepID=A0A1Q9ATT0_9HYPH|nr:hypothetical protein BJF93_16595 [Xaviernesmea oryzae]
MNAAQVNQDISALADWLKQMPSLQMSPLMQNPVAAFAAATAVGLGVTSQLAGLMMGAIQGMTEPSRRAASASARQAPAEPEQTASDAVGAAEEVAADGVVADQAAEDAVAPVAVPASEAVSDAPTQASAPAAETVAVPKSSRAKPVSAGSAAKAASAKTASDSPAVDKGAPAKTTSPARRRGAKGGADDLKRISGIGPKLEQVLNGLGVTRYAEIAGWSEDDVTRVDAQLGVSGRIVRDRWVEQARALIKN